ncbi:MAG: Uma2 family endonuclease [bacterium]|nr:Uma2 family endonuclease [bacterium]
MVEQIIPTATNSPAVNGPPQGQWTEADWHTLPDDGNRYEIIDGILYMSTAPSFFHQWIIKQLYRLVGMPAEEQGLAVAIFAPVGVFMAGAKPVQPDFLLVLAANTGIIHDRHIYGVPDFIAEVVSPGSTDYDENIKRKAYERAGVPEYAVIDPSARQLRLYQRERSDEGYLSPRIFKGDDVVTLGCLPEIPFHVRDLFSGSPDTTL